MSTAWQELEPVIIMPFNSPQKWLTSGSTLRWLHLSKAEQLVLLKCSAKEEQTLQTCLALFFSQGYLTQRCKGRKKTLGLTTSQTFTYW